jgi:hypothetical protein
MYRQKHSALLSHQHCVHGATCHKLKLQVLILPLLPILLCLGQLGFASRCHVPVLGFASRCHVPSFASRCHVPVLGAFSDKSDLL